MYILLLFVNFVVHTISEIHNKSHIHRLLTYSSPPEPLSVFWYWAVSTASYIGCLAQFPCPTPSNWWLLLSTQEKAQSFCEVSLCSPVLSSDFSRSGSVRQCGVLGKTGTKITLPGLNCSSPATSHVTRDKFPVPL